MTTNTPVTAIRGTLVSFVDDPFLVDPERAFADEPDGLIICRDGLIDSVGPYHVLRDQVPPGTAIADYSGCIVSAGFIDTHTHYVQSEIIAAPGEQLLRWVEDYIYPVEEGFADEAPRARSRPSFATRCCATARPRPQSIAPSTRNRSMRSLPKPKSATCVSSRVNA
jgi:cytosine/adenosine deaminase-related metal-dependent hydrolase